MKAKENNQMQVILQDLLDLRQVAINACFPASEKSFFSFKKQVRRDIDSAAIALFSIRKYFVGNIFNKNSDRRQDMIKLLLADGYRERLVEVFYLVTAQVEHLGKQELIELQKILGLRSEVIGFKGKK